MSEQDSGVKGKVIRFSRKKNRDKVVEAGDHGASRSNAQPDISSSETEIPKPRRPRTPTNSRDILKQALQEHQSDSNDEEVSFTIPRRTSLPGARNSQPDGIASLLSGAMNNSFDWDNQGLETAPSRPKLQPITPKEIAEQGVFHARKAREVARVGSAQAQAASSGAVFSKSDDAPQMSLADLDAKLKKKRQMNFVGVGVLMLFLAGLQFLFPGNHGGLSGKEVVLTQKHEGTKWRNPEMSSLEYYLCRGRSRAAGCSQQIYHPFVDYWENQGHNLRGDDLHRVVRNLKQTFYSPKKAPGQ